MLVSCFLCSKSYSQEIPGDTISDSYELILQRGLELFSAEPDSGMGPASCISCHNLEQRDTFNWNPDAYEISTNISDYDLVSFGELVTFPFGSDRLMEAHDGYDFTEKELNELRFFLGSLNGKELPQDIERSDPILLFIFLGIILILVLFDLLVVKRIYSRWLHWSIIIGVLTVFFIVIADDIFSIGLQTGYKPVQTLKFSHQLHCKDNEIDCYYCHSPSRHTRDGGIPGISICMNCHNLVREGSNSGERELAILINHWDNKKPMAWTKVNNLPDHVFFSHVQHVKIAEIDCSECHGNVEEMHLVRQEVDMTMSWCLDCHEATVVNKGGMDYYKKTFASLSESFMQMGSDSVTIKDIGGWDCMKCHR